MFRFIVRNQNDEQFGRFRFFCSSMRFALQFQWKCMPRAACETKWSSEPLL